MINSWVKKATDINANTDLMLANAVYFKGEWLEPFNHFFTERGMFQRLDGDLAEAEFMVNGLMTSSIRWQDIACMDGFKVLRACLETWPIGSAAPVGCNSRVWGRWAAPKPSHRDAKGAAPPGCRETKLGFVF
jgi:serpin B